MSGGGWIENSAQYETVPGPVQRSIGFSSATLQLSLRNSNDGLVLLAFDPTTMPADAAHRLTLRADGRDIPETPDPLASLLSVPGPSNRSAFARLSMNATVLAVFLPDLGSVSLSVQSVALGTDGLDRSTELAIVAAVFVVAVAAAIMFRRQDT